MLLWSAVGHLWAAHGWAFSHAWGLGWEKKANSALSLIVQQAGLSLFSWQRQGSNRTEVGKTSWGLELAHCYFSKPLCKGFNWGHLCNKSTVQQFCSTCFICIKAFHSHNTSVRWALLVAPLYRWRHWGTDGLSKFVQSGVSAKGLCVTMRRVCNTVLLWGGADTKAMEGDGTGYTALNAQLCSSSRWSF